MAEPAPPATIAEVDLVLNALSELHSNVGSRVDSEVAETSPLVIDFVEHSSHEVIL